MAQFLYVFFFILCLCLLFAGFRLKLLQHTASAIITQYERHTYGCYYSFYAVHFQLNSHMLCTVRICSWWKFISHLHCVLGFIHKFNLISTILLFSFNKKNRKTPAENCLHTKLKTIKNTNKKFFKIFIFFSWISRSTAAPPKIP